MAKVKNKYYAVARGRKPGIYTAWSGQDGAEAQIKGFSNPLFRGFGTLEDAEAWLRQEGQPGDSQSGGQADAVTIYTDGGCTDNPGPGGYAAVLLYKDKRKEIAGGFRRTTNNRMELLACIEALKSLKGKTKVILHSDSRYVVNGINKGWAKRWRANNWKRSQTADAENVDLWEQLLDLCECHQVEFVWVKGHAGNRENERCDRLVAQARSQASLPADTAYETNRTTASPLFK
jgi:ribonuclease HI